METEKIHVPNRYAPTEASQAHMLEVEAKLEALYAEIAKIPNCREKSVALTNIEQAAMWVNKAILCNQDQKPVTEASNDAAGTEASVTDVKA